MCLRNVEVASGGGGSSSSRGGPGEIFALIPLLTEEEARSSSSSGSSPVMVVDVLCANLACFFRDEKRWWAAVSARWESPRTRRSCGSSACLTVSRCCLVIRESSLGTNKRKRYVLDEHSVEQQPPRCQAL